VKPLGYAALALGAGAALALVAAVGGPLTAMVLAALAVTAPGRR
jgi:hypothetical protein